jgi:alanyl-tRNA synthetase
MGAAYPDLAKQQSRIEQVLRQEEERFSETLEHGMKILDVALAQIPQHGTLDGQTLFTLYDTYGFPVDLTADICRERDVQVDLAGFETAMSRQREQARAAGKFKAVEGLSYSGDETRFDGYEQLHGSGKVIALYVDGTSVESVSAGQHAIVVLDATPFYAESGGQVGDQGVLEADGLRFEVADTQKIQSGVFGHHGELRTGSLTLGTVVDAKVDAVRRARTVRNHSATHLMHKALRQVLGSHVQQRGSLVDPDKTRFDFAHDAPMTAAQIAEVEQIVNTEVLANHATNAQVMPYDQAVQGGAMALFGEKYGDTVRVLDIGFSRELCGGTHVMRTGDIGLFKILSESGVAAGVRRIEAITGDNALRWVQQTADTLQRAAGMIKTQPADLVERLGLLQLQMRSLERDLDQLKSKLAASAGNDLLDKAIVLNGEAKLLVANMAGTDPKALRGMVDQLKDRLKSAVVLLSTVADDKISLGGGVTSDLVGKVKAGDLVAMVASQVGGKGGGRPDMAMGGGTNVAALPGATSSVENWVRERLQ